MALALEMKVWGLLYTHHQVPDGVLRAMLASIRAMGLPDERLLICCHHPDSRLPVRSPVVYHKPVDSYWIPAIYEQMITGLERLPQDDFVLTLEHDILYPSTYLSDMAAQMKNPDCVYYYTLVRHIDLRVGGREDFWASDPNGTRTLQSCCGGRVGHLLGLARQDLAAYNAGTLSKDFELGLARNWERVDTERPVLDIRHGANTSSTGFDKTIHFATDYLPYWGHAQPLRARLMQA